MQRRLERAIAEVSETLGQGHREFRAQLVEQAKALTDEIQRKAADLTTAWKREATDLRNSKSDRAHLAALLNDVAVRLAGDAKGDAARK